jgi:hypothetical protein
LPSNDRRDTQTHRQDGDLISPVLILQNKENRLKIATVSAQDLPLSFFHIEVMGKETTVVTN